MILAPSPTLCAFSLGAEESRSYADLVQLITKVRERIKQEAPNATSLEILSRDRYHFAAAAFASIASGVELRIGAAGADEKSSALSWAIGGSAPSGRLDLAQLEAEEPIAVRPLKLEVMTERPWLTLTTSGSQGTPISWEKSTRQLFSEAEHHRQWLALEPSARIGLTALPEHIYGFLFGVLLPIVSGASFCRETPQHAASILAMTSKASLSHLVTIPAHARAVLADLEAHACAGFGSTLKTILSSGARLHPDLARALSARGLRVIDILGSTETGGIAWREPSRSEQYRALGGVQIEANAEGCLILRSPFLPQRSGPFRAEDRIEMEGDGFRYIGRGDRIVKVGATRVSLDELTTTVRAIRGVTEAFAFAKEELDPNDLRGHAIHLVVVTPVLDRKTLWGELRKRLTHASIPRHVRIIAEAPMDERGKVPIARLEALFDRPETIRAEEGSNSADS